VTVRWRDVNRAARPGLDDSPEPRQNASNIEGTPMTPTDIDRVQTYLRRLLGSDRIRLLPPAKTGLSVEVAVEEEVVGTIHRDDDEGEVSYALNIIILDEDMPPLKKAAAAKAPAKRR
jgi:hypothetical protein